MDYGNAGGSEFNWGYMGGMPGGQNNVYPQMGQMNYGQNGGDSQWLHSNQSHSNPYQQQQQHHHHSMQQGQSSGGPYEDYNQSMMRYTNVPKADAKSDMYGMGYPQQQQHQHQQQSGDHMMGMNSMGNSYGGYPPQMPRNGLGNPSSGMGQGGGYSSW